MCPPAFRTAFIVENACFRDGFSAEATEAAAADRAAAIFFPLPKPFSVGGVGDPLSIGGNGTAIQEVVRTGKLFGHLSQVRLQHANGLVAAGGSVVSATMALACCWLPLLLIAIGFRMFGLTGTAPFQAIPSSPASYVPVTTR